MIIKKLNFIFKGVFAAQLLFWPIAQTGISAAGVDDGTPGDPPFDLSLQRNHQISGNLTLSSVKGPKTLKEYRGKVVVLFFGYTHCPDVCPRDMSIMAQAFNGLDKTQVENAQGVFISLDPARDTIEDLDEFAHYFHSSFVGLTASDKTIQKLAERFGIHYQKVPTADSKIGYGVEHTASIYVLDKTGNLSFVLPNGISPFALQQAIQFLLNEQHS